MDSTHDPAIRTLPRRVAQAGARQPFGAYLFPGTTPEPSWARHLEQAVFLESFANSRELLDA